MYAEENSVVYSNGQMYGGIGITPPYQGRSKARQYFPDAVAVVSQSLNANLVGKVLRVTALDTQEFTTVRIVGTQNLMPGRLLSLSAETFQKLGIPVNDVVFNCYIEEIEQPPGPIPPPIMY